MAAHIIDTSESVIKEATSKLGIDYLTNKIGSGKLISKVRTRENFQLLEHMIHEMYTKDIKQLMDEGQSSEEAFDYGKKIGGNDLKRILDQSKEDVDKFLGLSLEEKPSIAKVGLWTIDKFTKQIWADYLLGYSALGATLAGCISMNPTYGTLVAQLLTFMLGAGLLIRGRIDHKHLTRSDCYYDVPCEKIRIKLKPEYFFNSEIGVKPVVDHEYSHFVLFKSLFKDVSLSEFSNKRIMSVFEEGFAMGVEEAMGRDYHKKTGNVAYILPCLELYLDILKYVYLNTASEISLKPSDALYKDGILKHCEAASDATNDDNVFHAYGYALFKILEYKHGLGIYRKTVNSDLSFL